MSPRARLARAGCAAAALLAAGTLASCDDPAEPPRSGSVALRFDHAVGQDSLVFGDLRYTNAAGNVYSVTALRYYVSDVQLRREDGTLWGLDAVHFRDAADPATRSWPLSGVPNGRYTEIRFTFGLDAQKNVTGTLPDTQENLNMRWPDVLGGGYHYLQLEGRYLAAGSTNSGYATHLGRQKVEDDPVAHHHYFEVAVPFPGGIDVRGDAWEAQVVMDVNGWYASPHVYDFDEFGPAVMENLVAQDYLMENGRRAFRLGSIGRP